jgi:TRAP transporter TAXI family solute receptor
VTRRDGAFAISRRSLLKLAPAAALAPLAAACGTDSMTVRPKLYHEGRVYIATGNTTGVYYQIGGGYADLISKYEPGYVARAEPTGASGDNIARIVNGDMDLGFCNDDTAADAVAGTGTFAGKKLPIVALARLYRNYLHCVVRNASKITKFEDLRGKRISTGTLNSGADIMSGRILLANGIDPDKDIVRQRLSLPDTTKGMQAGTTDALFFTGGLPTPGITDLLNSTPGAYALLSLEAELAPLVAKYGSGVYGTANLAKSVYNTPADVITIVGFNMIIASPNLPDQLAYDLTKLLYDHQSELAKVHPSGGDFEKANGPATDPVPLHPGARRYFQGL